jgi:hypothetical protein
MTVSNPKSPRFRIATAVTALAFVAAVALSGSLPTPAATSLAEKVIIPGNGLAEKVIIPGNGFSLAEKVIIPGNGLVEKVIIPGNGFSLAEKVIIPGNGLQAA